MMTRCLMAAVLATATGMGSVASATLITYDGFDTLTGLLHGTSSPSSTNWKIPWDSQSGPSSAGYKYENTAPMTFGALITSPGYASGGNVFETTGRRVLANFGSAWDAAGAVSSPFVDEALDQGVVWASFLWRKDVNNFSNQILTFHSSGVPWFAGSNPRLDVGYISGEFGPGISDVGGGRFIAMQYVGSSTVDVVTTVPIVIGDTYLMVLKFDFDQDVVSLYVNPSSLGGPAPVTADATLALDATFGFRALAWYAGRDAGSGSLDELRLGTTYASVTPIPEPAALGLLAPAAMLLARRRS
ncbi:MAG: hypothetical protein ACK4PI_09510 [Tepidisphaerales bacterium]